MGTWRIVAFVVLACVLCMICGGLSVDALGLAQAGGASLGCEGLALFYRTCRPDPRLSATLTAVAQLVILSTAGGAMSYAVATSGGPLWDADFASWDRTLGLDWRAYASCADHHAGLAWLGGLAYDSLKAQLLLVLLVLGFTGRTRELGEFCAAFAMAALAAVVLSGLMPALGAYPGLGIPPGRFSHILPRDVYDTAATVSELRRGGLRDLSFGDMKGIITFPSFHAASGVLVAVALWPVRTLRWPILVLDGLMIAATPLFGGHYFVDVLAGAAAALAAVAAARALSRDGAAGAAVLAIPIAGDLTA